MQMQRIERMNDDLNFLEGKKKEIEEEERKRARYDNENYQYLHQLIFKRDRK